ncbi:MAG: hypothetical protein H6710_13565 [Myxococcales bacterium]|nr:hypothetical protein [Myxococcales bacterium]MCB9705438.1 hypothetical protein [Myxococcales bacterium]
MSEFGVEMQATRLLVDMNRRGGYTLSLVCTDQGLLVAVAGDVPRSEVAAGLTSLFDDIVVRATRDLGVADVDEMTISDAKTGRFVVRPLAPGYSPRLFLVVQVPRDAAWRRNTTTAARKLAALMRPLLTAPSVDPAPAGKGGAGTTTPARATASGETTNTTTTTKTTPT